MKNIKYFALVLAALLALAFCGCTGEPQVTPDATPTAAAATDDAPTAEPTAEPGQEPGDKPTEEPAEEPTAEPVEVENLLDNNADLQQKVNRFISNFVEAGLADYDFENANEADLLYFAFIHCKINDQSAFTYDGNYAYLTQEKANEILTKYFGRFIQPTEGQEFQGSYNRTVKFADGKYSYPMGDGESYTAFAVARSLYSAEGGNLRADFDIYSQELTSYMENGFDSSLYSLTPADAAAKVSDGSIESSDRSGYALLDVAQSGDYTLRQYVVTESGN